MSIYLIQTIIGLLDQFHDEFSRRGYPIPSIIHLLAGGLEKLIQFREHLRIIVSPLHDDLTDQLLVLHHLDLKGFKKMNYQAKRYSLRYSHFPPYIRIYAQVVKVFRHKIENVKKNRCDNKRKHHVYTRGRLIIVMRKKGNQPDYLNNQCKVKALNMELAT